MYKRQNIISIHDIGLDQRGRVYFTMDLKSGKSFQELVNDEEERRSWLASFLKVSDAISYAHSQGILHLDLKPDNIQCGQFGEVLVCDWGLAKQEFSDEAPLVEHLEGLSSDTLYGDIKGSPGYMAPEQVDPDLPKDQRTDLFALGCLLYYCLTQHSPYEGSVAEIIKATQEAQITPPRQRFPKQEIPKTLDAITMKALTRDPEERYQSVNALIEDLTSYQAGHPTSVDRPTLLTKAMKFLGRHKLTATVTASFLVLTLLSSTVYWFNIAQKERQLNTLEEKSTRLELQKNTLEEHSSKLETRNSTLEYDLPNHLIQLMSASRQSFWDSNPRAALQNELEIAQHALKLSPNNNYLKGHIHFLNCVTLTFDQPYKDEINPSTTRFHYLPQYQSFSHVAPRLAPGHDRYATSELIRFFEKATKTALKLPIKRRAEYYAMILRYDQFHGPRRDNYPLAFLAALQSLYTCQDAASELLYDEKSKALTISSSSFIHTKYSNYNLLHNLGLESLSIKGVKHINPSSLRMGPLKHLDLSECDEVQFSMLSHFPHIETVTVKDEAAATAVRKGIYRREGFKVIVANP